MGGILSLGVVSKGRQNIKNFFYPFPIHVWQTVGGRSEIFNWALKILAKPLGITFAFHYIEINVNSKGNTQLLDTKNLISLQCLELTMPQKIATNLDNLE